MQDYNNRNSQGQKSESNSYNRHNGYQNKVQLLSPTDFLSSHPFNNAWITEGADENLVDFAEACGKYMSNNGLTNSKIRSVYGEIKRIQVGGFLHNHSSFFLLKPKMAYAVGRDPKNNGLKLFQMVFNLCFSQVGNEEKNYKNFCNLIEAILAYHKAYGGKD